MQISAVILTKNEEKNIKRCIESLLWCNEIIIIDDYSEDKTLREIKNFKARVYRRHLNSNFAQHINFYSTIHAQENKKTKSANIFYIITYPLGKFFVNYFLKLGFLDGVEGFVMAIFMSLHSFLAWGKLWLTS